MSNLSAILAAVSQELPCGSNLYEDGAYDVQFAGLVNAGLGIAPESFVESQGAALSPTARRAAWVELESQLVDLFRQTKHLDMLYLLALTEGHLHGIRGLIDGFDYTNNLLARQWDALHPQESEADYEYRQECLKKLDTVAFADCLDATTIADGRQLGKFSLGSWLAAKKTNPDELRTIEQALAETLKDQPSFYDEMASRMNELRESMSKLELTVKDKFVSFRLPFKALKTKLTEIAQLITGFSGVAIEGVENQPQAQGGSASPQAAVHPGLSVPDQINSREDVVKTLAKIILYYAKYEPTSPVPAMLERAQRVATMNFREIVQEFNLTGTPSIQEVLGWKNDEN